MQQSKRPQEEFLHELAITSSQLSCLAKCSLAIPIDTGWSRKDEAQISPLIPKMSIKERWFHNSQLPSPYYSQILCSCSKNLPHYRLSPKEWSNITFSFKNKNIRSTLTDLPLFFQNNTGFPTNPPKRGFPKC